MFRDYTVQELIEIVGAHKGASTRLRNILHCESDRTTAVNERELRRVPNAGAKTITELNMILRQAGRPELTPAIACCSACGQMLKAA